MEAALEALTATAVLASLLLATGGGQALGDDALTTAAAASWAVLGGPMALFLGASETRSARLLRAGVLGATVFAVCALAEVLNGFVVAWLALVILYAR